MSMLVILEPKASELLQCVDRETDDQITCTVGNKPSEAEYYVNDVSDVHTILETIEHLVDRLFKHDTCIKVVEDLQDLECEMICREEDGPVIF